MTAAALTAERSAAGGRLAMPTDAEVAEVAANLSLAAARLTLEGLTISLLNPLAGNRFHGTRPSAYRDEDHPLNRLEGLVERIDSLLTEPGMTKDADTEMDVRFRWKIAKHRWHYSHRPRIPLPDVVVLSNFGGDVSRRTAGLVSAIQEDGLPVAAWDPVEGVGADMLAEVPVLNREPGRLAALAVILDERRQERGEQ